MHRWEWSSWFYLSLHKELALNVLYIHRILACIIFILSSHIFIFWVLQSSWKFADWFSCRFFSTTCIGNILRLFFSLVSAAGCLSGSDLRASLPPLFLFNLLQAAAAVFLSAVKLQKTTNKTHRQTESCGCSHISDTALTHKQSHSAFRMRTLMATINITTGKGQWCHTGQVQKQYNESMNGWNMCDDDGQTAEERRAEWTRSPHRPTSHR